MSEVVKSPTIRLPEDRALQVRLTAKLEEYRKRVEDERGFKHPELAHKISLSYRDSLYKAAVLDQLLENGEVRSWDLSLELQKEHGNDFDLERFNNACGVIAAYAEGRESETFDGTGLPEV